MGQEEIAWWGGRGDCSVGGALVRRRRPQPSEHLGEEQFLAVSGVQLSSERIGVVVGQCRKLCTD